MTTVAALITQITNNPILGGKRQLLERLNGAIGTTSVEAITLEFSNPLVRPGTYIEVGDEVMYVYAATLPAASVLRGQLGTTAATHADNAMVVVDPRFTRQFVFDTLKAEMDSWPDEVFKVTEIDIEWAADTTAVDLTSSTGTVVRAMARTRNSTDQGPIDVPIELLRNQSATDFASTNAIRLQKGLVWSEAKSVRVRYGSRFTTPTATSTDLNSTTGLSAGLTEALRVGTVWRMLVGAESDRALIDGIGTVADREMVPPTHRMQAEQDLLEARDRLLNDEIRKIRRDFPLWGF